MTRLSSTLVESFDFCNAIYIYWVAGLAEVYGKLELAIVHCVKGT
jgi:hypothetical protein